MTSSADLRVLFRIAAGPRRGFGHLVRGISLARALGVRPLLCVRGPQVVVETALSLGADVVSRGNLRSLRSLRPDVVVIDDPVTAAARPWIDAARRAGAMVVTIHDLGIGCQDGDVVIDGSVTTPTSGHGPRVRLTGARYAILDPTLTGRRADRTKDSSGRQVLVALGGGPRRNTALAIAEAIAAADPHAHIRIAGGFSAKEPSASRAITWLPPSRGLAGELSHATVAVVGGGVSLYEACAAGVPAIGVPVVRSQEPTVRALGGRGAVVPMPFRASERRTASAVVALLDDPRRRAVLRRRAMHIVDGAGAHRAAAAVLSFMSRRRP